MKRIILLLAVFLTGCTTPKTILTNSDTGQVVSCGGNTTSSMFFGGIGYYMQKSDDGKCVSDYQEQGFKRTKTEPETQQADKQSDKKDDN